MFRSRDIQAFIFLTTPTLWRHDVYYYMNISFEPQLIYQPNLVNW